MVAGSQLDGQAIGIGKVDATSISYDTWLDAFGLELRFRFAYVKVFDRVAIVVHARFFAVEKRYKIVFAARHERVAFTSIADHRHPQMLLVELAAT